MTAKYGAEPTMVSKSADTDLMGSASQAHNISEGGGSRKPIEAPDTLTMVRTLGSVAFILVFCGSLVLSRLGMKNNFSTVHVYK